MLFIESRTLDRYVDGAARTAILERLEDSGFTPLIRAARLHLFGLALMKPERAYELEAAILARTELEGEASYVRGELFCFRDLAHYLIFGEQDSAAPGVRAGIIYEPGMADPRQKLEEFCRGVTEALGPTQAANGGSGANSAGGTSVDASTFATAAEWKEREPPVPEGFRRFAAEGESLPPVARGEAVEGWLRSAGMLEDAEARRWLRRLHEAHQEGRATTTHAKSEGDAPSENLLQRFAAAGLVRREILVSCRNSGRALFRLPSSDAFALLSGSNAICSECGASIADEKAEEVIVPTPLAATLLQDASWLTTHLRTILADLGLPERQVAVRLPSRGGAEAQLMANVCGELFLFLLRDGDWTAADARRAAEEHARTEGAHLVVIATGSVRSEARQRLREHLRLRAHGGSGPELILIEGMNAVATELQPAFERACDRTFGGELWELDTSLGISICHMLAERTRLLRSAGEMREMDASDSSAFAESLLEF